MTIKKVLGYLFIAATMILLVSVYAGTALANPLQFIAPVQTATATSTVSYMPKDTGTTTLSLDSYAGGQPKPNETATLLFQMNASSTTSVVNISMQYSQDGIDWYDDNLTASTTYNQINIVTPNSYTVTAPATTTKKAIFVQTPTRFVRAIFTAPVGTSSIWAQFVPLRQQNP